MAVIRNVIQALFVTGCTLLKDMECIFIHLSRIMLSEIITDVIVMISSCDQMINEMNRMFLSVIYILTVCNTAVSNCIVVCGLNVFKVIA